MSDIRTRPVCRAPLEHCNERRVWVLKELFKHRLFYSYRDGRITLARFQKVAAEIDGGEWAVPLYGRIGRKRA